MCHLMPRCAARALLESARLQQRMPDLGSAPGGVCPSTPPADREPASSLRSFPPEVAAAGPGPSFIGGEQDKDRIGSLAPRHLPYAAGERLGCQAIAFGGPAEQAAHLMFRDPWQIHSFQPGLGPARGEL